MGRPLLPAYVLSAVAVVTAILGSLVIFETASIKLTVPASRIVANKTLKGGPSGADIATTRIQADVTDSEHGTTATAPVPPTYATGEVVFTCSACTSGTTTVPNGTMVSTASHTHYATQSSADLTPQQKTVTVPIRAVLPGLPGNTATNTVTVIDKPITNVTVQNPKPVAGGAEAGVAQVVQQSDLDRVRAELMAKIVVDLNATLTAQAGGLSFVIDGQPTVNVTSDHAVGDRVATFTMTMSATQGAIAFSSAQADSLMRTALEQKIPKGFTLAPDPVETSCQVQKTSANGDVTIKGAAIGVVVPNITVSQLKSRIKGLRVDVARRQLEQVAPGVIADITVRPAVPWLPVLQDHIALTIVREPVTV